MPTIGKIGPRCEAHRPGRAIVRFRTAEHGVAAVEFALVGFPFLILIWGILGLGYMLFCSSTLDYATQKGARQIMVGATQNAGLTADQFRTTVLCPLLPAAMFDCSKVVVNLTAVVSSGEPTAYYSFVKADQSGLNLPPLDNTQTKYCTTNGNGYQVLEVLYPLGVIGGLLSTSAHVVNGTFVLLSTATFKNEPFSGGGATAPGC